jgi:hypothetical protein
MPKHFWHSEKIMTLEIFRQFENFYIARLFWADNERLRKGFVLPTIPSAVSHEREYVGKNNTKSSCEDEGTKSSLL